MNTPKQAPRQTTPLREAKPYTRPTRTSAFACVLSSLALTACGGGGHNEPSPTTPPSEPPQNVDLSSAIGKPAVSRELNEILLNAIRNDFARPTVHARNLFHISSAMYDAMAAYTQAETYLLGNTVHEFTCNYDANLRPGNTVEDVERSMSAAAYRLLVHRFRTSPGISNLRLALRNFMNAHNFSMAEAEAPQVSDYSASPEALGAYIAQCYIDYGLADGSNEANNYANTFYTPLNPAIEPAIAGNPNIVDLNHWQPIKLDEAIDQSGNVVEQAPPFLGPEWGNVYGFNLSEENLNEFTENGHSYRVWNDPGAPPQAEGSTLAFYQWNFATVARWSADLDVAANVEVDTSPASIGNLHNSDYPQSASEYPTFYQKVRAATQQQGYALNPVTGMPYVEQRVNLGDYTRVLAEFWADGPDSETPPGHWFVIANSVLDDDRLALKIENAGSTLSELEYTTKLYFTLGAAMHDAAISAWSIKGRYDFIRPISAIRAMADYGQSSDPNLPSYHELGLPLTEGEIELVQSGDPLAGTNNEHVGKIKIYAWRGHEFVNDQQPTAGAGWMLAERWWPYQRPSFVTPPFAGYISGHSTFSRAAAEVLTRFTGSEYFPGGLGEFPVEQNQFLVFEQGPSASLVLQWAKYRDAADQCSLSRIWGGIHPPIDDVPGRLIGEKVGNGVFERALGYFGE